MTMEEASKDLFRERIKNKRALEGLDDIPQEELFGKKRKYDVPTQTTQTGPTIAIVGIGCRTPGADNIREFWRVLKNGENHVIDVPESRWNAKAYLDPDPTAPGKAWVQKGGFIKNVRGFDNGLYGINDSEASQMDPQQAMLLECTTMALEDAGIPQRQLSGSNTGVYIGCMNSDFSSTIGEMNSAVDSNTLIGASSSVLAGRMSYVFNLLGPSMVIDTACSSSLLAVHQACLAILSGDCEMAVCGGVNCMLIPDVFCHLTKARMISPSGQCHAFSDKADGYARGEGCGVIILKRLDKAVLDGDKIWATVGTGVNQDGRTVSPIAAPSTEQQKNLLHAVYDKFQVDLSQLDYIEAHGTGTPVGDPVEVNALGAFFKERGETRDRYIGSLKTNIGHTESAAGILGVIKVCLMMKHGVIVPSLNCQVVNPNIAFSDFGFIIPQPGDTIRWDRPDKVAGCSSYGFSGTNCHAVLKSVREKTPEVVGEEEKLTSNVVCFSGKCLKSLKGSLADFADDEDAVQSSRVEDVSYTSTLRRHHYPYRTAFLAQDMEHLMNSVRDYLARDERPPPVNRKPDVVFVFCGMSTEWNGMCRELLTELSAFRDAVVEIDKILSSYVSWSLTERLMQEDASSDLLLSSIAIFACQVGLVAVWKSLGITPACVVGQSIGEVATAYTAGCLSLADAVSVIYHRSKLLSEVSGGSMVLVRGIEVDKVRQILTERFGGDQATIAMEYSNISCAVSAATDVMPDVEYYLRNDSTETLQLKKLDVSVAYHSRHVSSCANELAIRLEDIDIHASKVPMQSTVTGMLLETPPGAQYWADTVQKPVLFKQAITEAFSHCTSTPVFLEIGPRPVLQAHLRDIFPGQTITDIPSMIKPSQPLEMETLKRALIALYEKGADINWKAIPAQHIQITEVPRYAFDRKNNMKMSEVYLLMTSGVNFIQKNHLYTYPVQDQPSTYQLMISPLAIASVYDHKLSSGKILLPGAFLSEACLAIGRYLQMNHPVVSIDFTHPVWLKADQVMNLVAESPLPPGGEEGGSRPLLFWKGNIPIASADLLEDCQGTTTGKVVNLDYIRTKCRHKVEKEEMYSALRKLGFDYGSAFSLLQHASKASAEYLALLTVTDGVKQEMATTVFHPSILDGAFQTTFLAFLDEDESDQIRLPKSIGRLVVHHPMESSVYVHTRLKENDAKKYVFDMQIISPTGLVIAEIRDFVLLAVQSLSEEILLKTVWRKVPGTGPISFTDAHDADAGSFLFIANRKEFQYGANDIVFEGAADWKDVSGRLESVLNEQCTPSALVLVYATDVNDDVDGDSIHSELVAMCCLLREILKTLKDASCQIDVYLCTFNAWSVVAGDVVISPAATALWGLLRAVNREVFYVHIRAVELHLPSCFSYKALPSLLTRLGKSEILRKYTELLITEDEVLANLVVRDESTPITTVRHGTGLNNAVHQHSENYTTGMSDADDEHQTQSDMIRIRIEAFVLTTTGDETGHLTAEVRGRDLDQGTEVASCYPVIAKQEVFLPSGSFVPTSLIPNYQLGDVSKLIVLSEVRRMILSPEVTILASDATSHLAELLKLMCSNEASAGHTSHVVTIVLLETLDSCIEFSDTVISLVLLDTALLFSIWPKMTKSKYLITFSSLAQPQLLQRMNYMVPHLEVTELAYQLLFQPTKLMKTIPQVLGWVKDNQSNIAQIAEALHKEASKATSPDLNRLLPESGTEMIDPTVETRIKKNVAYVVVGGLTGLGWTCVEFLAREKAGYIAILNRRAPTDEHVRAIDELSKKYSCRIRPFQADVTSVEKLKHVIDDISNDMEIRGVFMGAAVTEDMPFLSTTKETFDRVLSAKVKGAWNLHQLLRTADLDYFVLHSSIASVIGNPGQSHYCAANAFLDGLAMYRYQRKLPVQTINWGPLDMGILENEDRLKARLADEGLHIATREEVLDTLNAVLPLKPTQCVPARIHAEPFAHRMLTSDVTMPMRFQELSSFAFVNNPAYSATRDFDLSVARMKTMTPEQRARTYEDFLLSMISQMKMLDPGCVSQDVTFVELGVDSLLITMILDQIQRATTFKVPPEDIFGDATIASLAGMLCNLANVSI